MQWLFLFAKKCHWCTVWTIGPPHIVYFWRCANVPFITHNELQIFIWKKKMQVKVLCIYFFGYNSAVYLKWEYFCRESPTSLELHLLWALEEFPWRFKKQILSRQIWLSSLAQLSSGLLLSATSPLNAKTRLLVAGKGCRISEQLR